MGCFILPIVNCVIMDGHPISLGCGCWRFTISFILILGIADQRILGELPVFAPPIALETKKSVIYRVKTCLEP